jgi:uncharacterized protein DUF2283
MGEKLTFEYDKIGDILYINKCRPYVGQDSEELEDDVVARFNPDTHEIENLEILFFTKRLEQDKAVLELPVTAHLHLNA